MSSANYESNTRERVAMRTVFIGALAIAALAGVVLGITSSISVRSVREAHDHEVSALKAQQAALERSLAEAQSRVGNFQKRLDSLEWDKKQLESDLHAEALKAHLIPKIGQVIVVTGAFRDSKMGWYVALDGFDASIWIQPKEATARLVNERSLERYNGKKVVVTGTLNFGSDRDSTAQVLDRFERFYFDPTECRIEEKKEPKPPATAPSGRGSP